METGLTSFRQLFGDGERIEIPMIQRDFAQGRPDQKELRVNFVENLHRALQVDTSADPLDLDFVYGRWRASDKTLEPLDGQQRLTTLFLLHWYLANCDGGIDDFRSWMSSDSGACFSYRTRESAKEFFDALVDASFELDKLLAQSRGLSDWVTDQPWFVRSWRYDPTVSGCLTMLDAIHEEFRGGNGAYRRLVAEDEPPIVFRLLLLEKFDLSDDLYIKMNARGKALTSFEVFKAQLEEFIGDAFGDEPCPHATDRTWRKYVSQQFDTEWTDFMWRYRNEENEIDSRFMHLIRAVAVIECVEADDEGQDSELEHQLKQLLDIPEPSLTDYEDVGCLSKSFVERLVDLFNTLAAAPDLRDEGFLESADYVDESALFEKILADKGSSRGGVTFVDWVKFYAYCSFLLQYDGDLETDNCEQIFSEWMRVIRNLAENSEIDRADRFARALSGVQTIVENGTTPEILHFVADGGIESGFSERQLEEEQLKAQLLLRESGWRELIEKAETHSYFRGYIGFLLRFSGVFQRWQEKGDCQWPEDDDEQFREEFSKWFRRTCAVFPPSSEGLESFPDYLWERALLATGDYLLERRQNMSFVRDSDRDVSWKRLLRADTQTPNAEGKRDIVRSVLERVDPNDVTSSLQQIIDEGVQDNADDDSATWRRLFVAEPRLLDYCNKRMIRFDRGNESVFLLNKAQRNGYHTDLFIYHLYLRLSDRADAGELGTFTISDNPEVKGAVEPHQLVLCSDTRVLTVKVQIDDGTFEFRAEPDDSENELQLGPNWERDEEGNYIRRGVPKNRGETVVEEMLEA
jgi:hypothetical protein